MSGSVPPLDVVSRDEFETFCRVEIDPNCRWRFPDEWSFEERVAILSAISYLEGKCPDAGAKAREYYDSERIGIWDARVPGTTHAGQAGIVHGSIEGSGSNVDIGLWTGAGSQPGDQWNLPRTLAHEAYHELLWPDTNESRIDAAAAPCGY